jgi:erythronate-4-phosphate dehydrogenase
MKILADKSIPFIQSFFSDLGELELIDSSEFTPDRISDADVLLVRSITRVNEELLSGSDVQFVATATSGHDHIDIEYLNNKQIRFAHAPGCNARSVAEYVISSLSVLAQTRGISLHGKTAGIIGCGHVGSTVYSMLRALEIECLVYDPPLQNQGASYKFCTIEDLHSADIITVHVPLVLEGDYPSYHMIDSSFLEKLKPDVILINSSRGSVIEEKSLLEFMSQNPESALVLDVWENEPNINMDMLSKTVLSTPHIAGYSLDGRLKGTQMICKQFCDYLNKPYEGPQTGELPKKVYNRIPITEIENDADAIQMAILASYDVRTDSIGLRQLSAADKNNSEILKDKLLRLGFTVA